MDTDSKIKVLLVDDHQTIQAEIGALLASLDGIELVAQAYNGEEAVRLCDEHIPDVVLMDVSMPVMNGIVATRTITTRHPDIKIIAMTGLDDRGIVQNMMKAGAVGYLLKDADPKELVSTIHAVYGGISVFSFSVVPQLLDHKTTKSPQEFALTRRELDILQAMSMGLNNSEVAAQLNISTSTVRFHITNIIDKLGAENRTEALILAVRYQLV